jgi:hypothetical protein
MNIQQRYDRNRQAVQKGLDARKAQRKEAAHDAYMDAQERALRDVVNRKSKERQAAIEAAQAAQQLQMKRNARRLLEVVHQEFQWHRFIRRTYASLIVFAAFAILYAIDAVAFWLAITGMTLALIFCANNYVAYVTRNKHHHKHRNPTAITQEVNRNEQTQ